VNANCDGDMTNGCEADLKNDPNHCGTCGTLCAQTGGSNTCVNGVCVPACDGADQDCDGNVVNGCESAKAGDANNCGACGVKCLTSGATSTSCVSGGCQPVCDSSHQDCDGNHVNGCESIKASDNSICGQCGTVCQGNGGSNSCVAGLCDPHCDADHKSGDGNKNNGC